MDEKIIDYLKKLEANQKEIDEKTKKAEVYRDYSNKLLMIIKCGIIGFFIFLTLAVFIVGSTVVVITENYFNYERGIERTTTLEKDEITGSGSSIIMNRSDGASVNGK